jgi:hypothetical protein
VKQTVKAGVAFWELSGRYEDEVTREIAEGAKTDRQKELTFLKGGQFGSVKIIGSDPSLL